MISSSDPNAIALLQNKLSKLEALQTKMREANKALRQNNDARLYELGFSLEGIQKLKTPDFCGRTCFPDFRLTNNSSEIRRTKKRLAELTEAASQTTNEYELFPGCICKENVEINRVQLLFDEKPNSQVRTLLKQNGFKWSPTNAAWQRHLNTQGKSAVQWVKQKILELNNN
jgi:hypothetical protein